MKIRIIIFIHALAIVLLQAIPNTVILPGYNFYWNESFFDMLHLWGMGALWYPLITLLSIISLVFAVVLLICNCKWSKIVIVFTNVSALLLMLIPIIMMIKDINCFSVALVIIFVLLISESIIIALSMKRR